MRAELFKKLQAGKIDLVIAMGTWAGEDLVNDSHTTPTLVMSASAFEKTGILQQVVEFPLFLSINSATARAIGFRVPESIHKIARDIYEQ